jgi:hypothetical protein
MATSELGIIDGQKDMRAMEGPWVFDEDDWLLIAMLQDPIYCAELLFNDPLNYAYSGCYHVRDYQYPLFRPIHNYQTFPCARDVGKTESIKARAVSHAFKRLGEGMLITAPELIHLEPLTQQIESRILETRLTRDFLKTDNQKTGFTHKPFQCDFADGTQIIGRIPKISGTGVKGQHVPDLIVEEAQDYPPNGWTEVFPTVLKDHVGPDGQPDYTFHCYGVHSAGRGGKFGEIASGGEFRVTAITAPMKPSWNGQEKRGAAAMYGGTNSPDYRRNMLGEPGTSYSQFFVTSHLMACMDQDSESKYNTQVFKEQQLSAEELPNLLPPGGDVGELLDLPENLGQQVYCGMDVGLVTDPTVITIWAVLPDEKRTPRLTLVRMIFAWRFTEGQIRQLTYRIARQYGQTLRAFGQDITGLGLPLYQAAASDEQCPKHLKEVMEGYVFNAKVPVAVDPDFVSEQGDKLIDQYGHMVEVVHNKWTGGDQLVAKMTMIEASTRYLRGFVDEGFLRLPFHQKLIKDFQGETTERIRAMAGVKKKPNAFHMLDSSRAMAMAYKQGEVDEQVYVKPTGPVLDKAINVAGGIAEQGMQISAPTGL